MSAPIFLCLKGDFPLWAQPETAKLIYFDSAATAQKPRVVIEAISKYYQIHTANIHRGVHRLAELSTSDWEDSRKIVAEFFRADPSELIITRNTTEALNGVAYGWADHNLKPGDYILTTIMEHHANLVPWQQACLRTGAKLLIAGVTDDGRLDEVDWLEKLKTPGVKLIAFSHVSNVTGAVLPAKSLTKIIRKIQPNARVVLDAAQSAPHVSVNFSDLGVDFLAFSGHKMYGPMGIGGLFVKKSLLDSGEFQPWLFGGGMIDEVWPETASFNPDPVDRFTAGTPDVASLVGLAAAVKYLENIGQPEIVEHERELINEAYDRLKVLPEIKIIGPDPSCHKRVGSIAFIYKGVHAHDVAQVMESQNLAVRSGHHCAMPLHVNQGWTATTRISFGVYNNNTELDRLVAAIKKVGQVLKPNL